MSEEKILNNWNREPKALAHLYEFYICGEIEDPELYIDTFDTIRHAKTDDHVKIYINSFGGNLFTAIQFLRVISETEAFVTASIEGACMSAATLLFLAADSVEVTAHSSVMLHDYSSGAFGKGGELHRQIQHERLWSSNLFRESYKDFLTEQEIEDMLNGKDIWLTPDEVTTRMRKRAEIRNTGSVA